MADLEREYRTSWYQTYRQRKNLDTEGVRGSRTALEKQHRHIKSLETTRWAMAREDKVLLSNSAQGFDAFIQFWVNPSECSWNLGLRSAIDKTSGGAVHYEIQPLIKNEANFTRFDLPTIGINFQAGIITPGGYNDISNGDLPNVRPHGLANFYDFIDLVDQPNTTPNGLPNFVNILYVSSTFGAKGVWLRGFFDENGISWTDSADNPNTITNWTATFIVCSSNPPFNKLRQAYQSPVSR